mgnify:CR=1 FL=1
MNPWILKSKEALSGPQGRRLLAEICLAALLTGAALGWALHISLHSTAGHSPDAQNYIAMAQRLVEEGVYSFWGNGPDAYVTPGYPLFLAGCMALFGTGEQGILAVRVLQCLLAAATVLLTYLLGRRVTGSGVVGLIAAALLTGNVPYYYYSQRVLTETLYFFTMVVFFLAFVAAREKGGWARHLVAGMLLAVSVLVRPQLVILVPFLYLPHLWKHRRDWKAAWIPLLCFLGGFVAVCLPWWVRNLVTLHRFVPLATQTNPIFAGLAPDVYGMGLKNPGSLLGNVALFFQLLGENFVGTLNWMTLGKFQVIFLTDFTYSPIVLTAVVKDITLYLGLFGGLLALFTRKGRRYAVLFWIYFLSAFLFVPTSRYSLQYYPLMAIFAGWLLVTAFTAVRRRERSPSPEGAA